MEIETLGACSGSAPASKQEGTAGGKVLCAPEFFSLALGGAPWAKKGLSRLGRLGRRDAAATPTRSFLTMAESHPPLQHTPLGTRMRGVRACMWNWGEGEGGRFIS